VPRREPRTGCLSSMANNCHPRPMVGGQAGFVTQQHGGCTSSTVAVTGSSPVGWCHYRPGESNHSLGRQNARARWWVHRPPVGKRPNAYGRRYRNPQGRGGHTDGNPAHLKQAGSRFKSGLGRQKGPETKNRKKGGIYGIVGPAREFARLALSSKEL